MISEYKLYHGSVLADIVDASDDPITIRSCANDGRLLNYIINGTVAIQVKYATQRLHPWHFSFPMSHIRALESLASDYLACFVVLVCRTDGAVAVPARDALAALLTASADQAWLRADRKKREMYRLYGPNGEFPTKFKTTIEPIVEALKKFSISNKDGQASK